MLSQRLRLGVLAALDPLPRLRQVSKLLPILSTCSGSFSVAKVMVSPATAPGVGTVGVGVEPRKSCLEMSRWIRPKL